MGPADLEMMWILATAMARIHLAERALREAFPLPDCISVEEYKAVITTLSEWHEILYAEWNEACKEELERV